MKLVIFIAPFGSHEIQCVMQEKQWESNCWKIINVLTVFLLAACQSFPYSLFRSSRKLLLFLKLESTDPRESEIRAPLQPLPYLVPIPPNTLFYNKKFITAFLSLGLGNTL